MTLAEGHNKFAYLLLQTNLLHINTLEQYNNKKYFYQWEECL